MSIYVVPLNQSCSSMFRDPFIIFGPEFPGQATVQWTPRIYVYRGPDPDTKWRLHLESITLLVPKAGVNINYDSEEGYDALAIQTNISVVMDMGQARLAHSRRPCTKLMPSYQLPVSRYSRTTSSNRSRTHGSRMTPPVLHAGPTADPRGIISKLATLCSRSSADPNE